MNLKFHHIGIATSDINEAIKTYQNIGYDFDNMIYEDNKQDVKIAFLKLKNHPLIEIVAPLSINSHLNNIIKKISAGSYHTCYEVNDIEETLKFLRKKNFIIIKKPVEAIAFNNRKVSFLFNKDIGIVELLESENQ